MIAPECMRVLTHVKAGMTFLIAIWEVELAICRDSCDEIWHDDNFSLEERGPFHLGRYSWAINVASAAVSIFQMVPE